MNEIWFTRFCSGLENQGLKETGCVREGEAEDEIDKEKIWMRYFIPWDLTGQSEWMVKDCAGARTQSREQREGSTPKIRPRKNVFEPRRFEVPPKVAGSKNKKQYTLLGSVLVWGKDQELEYTDKGLGGREDELRPTVYRIVS